MRAKGIVAILAGQASIVAILAIMLALALASTPLLREHKATVEHVSTELAVAKAEALAEALLATGADRAHRGETFIARRLHGALASSTSEASPQSFEQRAIAALKAQPDRPYFELVEEAESARLLYARTDRADGVLILETPLAREQAAIEPLVGEPQLSVSTVALLVLAVLCLGAVGVRHVLRELAQLPEHERRTTIVEGLKLGAAHGRHNLLPWLLALCGLIFLLDLAGKLDAAIGVGYLIAVALSLRSNKPWHVTVIASVAALLLCLAPFVSPYHASSWAELESHALTLFAIFVMGFFGSANLHKSRAEALALAEAMRSRDETAELRAALERAEAAEAQNRRVLERMRMANESAGISVFEWLIAEDLTYVDAGSPFLKRLGDGSNVFKGSEYAERFVHPEDREEWRNVFRRALNAPPGQDLFSHRYRALLPGGSIAYIQMHGRVLRDASGQPSSVLAVDWEVTREEEAKLEIARQAQQLREAQERFQRAVSGTQDALFEFNLVTGEMWHSPRFMEMLGYDSEETAPTSGLESLVHPEDQPRLAKAMIDHLQKGTPYDIEYRLRKRDGEWLWVRSRAAADGGEDGRRAGSGRHRSLLCVDRVMRTHSTVIIVFDSVRDGPIVICATFPDAY